MNASVLVAMVVAAGVLAVAAVGYRLNKRRVDDARKRRLLAKIQNRIWSHAVTIRVSTIVDAREASWNTATGTLVRLEARLFVFTAWHVINKFVEIREQSGTPLLIIGNYPMLSPRFVYLDEISDLIVLEVDAAALRGIGAVPYEPVHQWPPPRVKVDDPIMLCGFPALLRLDGDEILHGDYSFFGSVESVSERQFIVQLDRDNVEDAGRVPFPNVGADLGGLSGCPVFVLYPDHMQFVGVFSQAARTAPVWIIRSIAGLPENLGALAALPV